MMEEENTTAKRDITWYIVSILFQWSVKHSFVAPLCLCDKLFVLICLFASK